MPLSYQRKRPKQDEHIQAKTLVEKMAATVTGISDHVKRLLNPQPFLGGFDFSQATERQRAINYLWAGDYSDCTRDILRHNPDYEEILEEKTRNKYMMTKRFDADAAERRKTRLNYTAGVI